jgi:hypothetical protein
MTCHRRRLYDIAQTVYSTIFRNLAGANWDVNTAKVVRNKSIRSPCLCWRGYMSSLRYEVLTGAVEVADDQGAASSPGAAASRRSRIEFGSAKTGMWSARVTAIIGAASDSVSATF